VDRKKIIIDAYQYSPSITGTDRMAYNFLKQLQKIDSVNEYTVICSNEEYIRTAIKNSNFKVLNPNVRLLNGKIKRVYSALWRRLIIIIIGLKKYDTFLSFHNMRTPFIKVAKKTIAFNLDLIPLVLDGYDRIGHSNKNKLTRYYKKTVDKADAIISISKYSESELNSYFLDSKAKSKVIYLGCGDEFKSVNKNDSNYLLTIGGAEPRKNVNTVIDTYSNLPKKIQTKYKLKVVGGDWHNHKLITDKENVELLGFVDNKDLIDLYQNTSLFVFASSYEGFGFSVLEAMKCGSPVLCSDATSLPEIGDSAVEYFSLENFKELTNQMTKILSSKEKRLQMSKKGKKRSEKFSWEKSTSELLKILIS
jgi:glycosyltransferase involved in cell wall biosynthesis